MDAPFTGAGDGGETWCLLTGGRVSKTHPCIEAVGALDEAEAAVALARTLAARAGLREVAETLEALEGLLFRVGYSLSGRSCVTPRDLEWAEAEAARLWRLARGWRGFRLNGATPEAAAAAAARTAV
ncbi:MAG: ATP:cob(I)alamin adenosyltransferase, partial [Crenarchaeota archaeon]|nr:ATP:cob(I)alamin adenosyltransferase [Thermoproteota archaeon]